MKEVPISSKKDVLKKDRGHFQVAHTSNQGKGKTVVVWKDNEAVIMALNYFGSEPIQKAKRWDRKKKKVSIDIPYVAHKYNKYFNGRYRPSRSKHK